MSALYSGIHKQLRARRFEAFVLRGRNKGTFAVVILLLVLGGLAYSHSLLSKLTKDSPGKQPQTVQTLNSLIKMPGGLLAVNGTHFVDSNGNIVLLRGVNLSGYEYSPPEWIHNSSDFKTIADWGFNVVRLPISWENLEPKPGQYNDSYLQLVEQDVAWAKQYGLYVVLDMHEICWSTQFASCNNGYTAGIPGWAVASYPDSIRGIDLMLHDFYLGLGPNGTSPSFANPSIEARLFAAWKYVAEHFSNDTTIAAYDILNEPTQWDDSLDYNATFTGQVLPAFYTDAIEAIRTVDSNHICLFEDPTSIPILLPNVAYAPHYPQVSLLDYEPIMLTQGMNRLLSLSAQWNVPLFIGEWGMYANASGIVQYINAALSIFDSHSVSAAWWDYSRGNFPMDLFDPEGNPRQVLVQNIVRPFVEQTSSNVDVITLFNSTSRDYEQFIQFQSQSLSQMRWIMVAVPDNFSANVQNAELGTIQVRLVPQARSLIIEAPASIAQIVIVYTPLA